MPDPKPCPELWDAINEYVAACGGFPDRCVYGNLTRQQAVAKIEKLWNLRDPDPRLEACQPTEATMVKRRECDVGYGSEVIRMVELRDGERILSAEEWSRVSMLIRACGTSKDRVVLHALSCLRNDLLDAARMSADKLDRLRRMALDTIPEDRISPEFAVSTAKALQARVLELEQQLAIAACRGKGEGT